MKRPSILLVGLGHLGGVLLEHLGREASIGRIVCCSRNRVRGEARCNLARLGALARGLTPRIDYLPVDLRDRERFAEELTRISPDLVLSTASMQTWWLADLLPREARERLARARFAMWLPCHLAPTLHLMAGIAEADYDGPVLTAPFPDVVNCMLGCIGRAPTCGVGNLDEIVAKIRLAASRRLEVPIEAVEVLLVAHHALEASAFGAASDPIPPYFLRVIHADRDVTSELNADELLRMPYPMPGGPVMAHLTAGSTNRLVTAVLSDAETALHAPAPGGLPGGYPVLAGAGQVRPAPIEGLSLEEAVAINERSHRFDGIERIEPDGTAIFVPQTVETLRSELGYDCERLPLSEAAERGRELMARFSEYAARHGTNLQTVD